MEVRKTRTSFFSRIQNTGINGENPNMKGDFWNGKTYGKSKRDRTKNSV